MKRTWFIGIDISKCFLDVVIYDQENKKVRKHFKISNEEKGFKELLKLLKEEVCLEQTFICLEYCGIYGLGIGLFLDGKVDFNFCSPLHIKRSLGLTRGKNDKLDAYKIARFCYLFRDDLSPSSMPTANMLKLKSLMSERNRVVKSAKIEKTVLKELSVQLDSKSIKRMEKRLKWLNGDIKIIEKEILEIIRIEPELEESYNLLISITGIGLLPVIVG